MMTRNNNNSTARPQTQTHIQTPHSNPTVPSIRLISATPSAAGSSADGSIDASYNRSLEEAWAAIANANAANAALAPKTAAGGENGARKRLVPKKSKLSLLGMGIGLGSSSASTTTTTKQTKERARDFSDIARRVGADMSARGGFEIYVDPEVGGDGDGEAVVVVKKKKSRGALDGMSWGAREVTNVPKALGKEGKEGGGAKEKGGGLLKVKVEEGQKWWSIGRGRKDSKEDKKDKENKISHQPIEYIHDPHPRSKTPDLFKPSKDASRARFNSLDSGVLLNGPINMGPAPVEERFASSASAERLVAAPPASVREPASRSATPTATATFSRSATPTISGFLAPPATLGVPGQQQQQGSIALRAMRSVRSLARIGSWAQLKNMPAEEGEVEVVKEEKKEKEKGKGEKDKKEKKDKKKKEKKESGEEGKEKKDKKKKSTKKDKSAEKETEKEKAQSTVRLSSSSFEAGALTSSPGPAPAAAPSQAAMAQTLGPKKHSILGLGLPSSLRLPSATRVVSTSSSASSNAGIAIGTIGAPQRLSADYAKPRSSLTGTIGRPASQMSATSSAGSSLRPLSTTSSSHSRSSRSSAGSVRWDEEGLETVREQRRLERAASAAGKDEKTERRTSRESKHSVEGRRRTPLTSVFPEVAPSEEEGMDIGAEREERRGSYPILTIEEATADGHGPPDDDEEIMEEDEGSVEEEVAVSQAATPVKKARPRPLSEQLLGKSRPKPMYEDEEGVLSILDAATNDLALLINNLDLQATPSTPGDLTPLRPLSASADATPSDASQSQSQTPTLSLKKARRNVADSPLKTLRKNQLATMSSVSSLRPYAQSRAFTKPANVVGSGPLSLLPPAIIEETRPLAIKNSANKLSSNNNNANAALISQQIAPWETLLQGLSPVREKVRALNAKATPSPSAKAGLNSSVSSTQSHSTFRPGHKRTMTPAPEPEPEPVFQPLRPARSRLVFPKPKASGLFSKAPTAEPVKKAAEVKASSNNDDMDIDELEVGRGSLTPVFKRIHEDEQERERERKRSSRGSLLPPLDLSSRPLSSSRSSRGSRTSTKRGSVESRAPIGREARRVLGMSGTMGGSDVSMYNGPEPDASDPDSDVPDELRYILRAGSALDNRASVYGEDMDEDYDDALNHLHHHGGQEDEEDHTMDIERSQSTFDDGPPSIPLPVFRAALITDDDEHRGVSESPISLTSDENNTKASFDWTGELHALNSSGASDRRSFVEQLEHAFKTPAKVDLRYAFADSLLQVPAPPVPALPIPPVPRIRTAIALQADESTSSMGEGDEDEEGMEEDYDSGALEGVVDLGNGSSGLLLEGNVDGGERLVDVRMPTLGMSMFEDTTGAQNAKDSMNMAQESQSRSRFDMFPTSADAEMNVRIVDVSEPSMFDKEGDGSAPSFEDPTEDSIFDDDSVSPNGAKRPSDGELDRSFRFGGVPRLESSVSLELGLNEKEKANERPLTLSDIIPPPSHARALSECSLSMEDNSSVLREIDALINIPFARIVPAAGTASSNATSTTTNGAASKVQLPQGQGQARERNQQQQQQAQQAVNRRSIYKGPSRPTSGISFTGLGDSFEEARRNFEFTSERPAFYPPPAASRAYNHARHPSRTGRRARHAKMESVFSIASVSSYGHVIRPGSSDPFQYADALHHRLDESEENYTVGMSVMSDLEDTFAFRRGEGVVVPSSLRYFGGAGGAGAGGMNMNGGGRRRERVESDASTFSFHAPMPSLGVRGHRRRESNMSTSSIAPPISLFNRPYPHGIGHRRNDSTASNSSMGHHSYSYSHSYSYARHSQAWKPAGHRRDMSTDSVSMGSEFSVAAYSYIGRPGVGEKMFDRPGVGEKMFDAQAELGPLTSITASPPESTSRSTFSLAQEHHHHQQHQHQQLEITEAYDSLPYDSIMDEERRFDDEDSLFERTRWEEVQRDSVESDEVFGDYPPERHVVDAGGNRLRPPLIQSHRWSMYTSDNTTGVLYGSDKSGVVGEEDTMLSMLGGGQAPVHRQSILESPCPRVEKRKHSAMQGLRMFKGKPLEEYESPSKARIVEKPSIASTSSFQFGGERMIKAQRGLLERQSLEDSALIADGEDLASAYFSAPVFTRPAPTTRSRSSTCTTSSSGSVSGSDTPPLSTGGETPPLMHQSDASSISEGSQSSIDLSQINIALSNATSPVSGLHRVRARARGAGHRRRYSNAQQCMSRSSVYETIEEDVELTGRLQQQQQQQQQAGGSPALSLLASTKKGEDSPTTRQAVFIVDGDTATYDAHAESCHEESIWDDERGIIALRKYYALRDEAQTTVTESRRMWSDTPFSLFAIQTFQAPAEPAGMQALLEYSVQNYGPLPSELRPRRMRSRTSSRPSPYPHGRLSKIAASPEQIRTAKSTISPENARKRTTTTTTTTTTVTVTKESKTSTGTVDSQRTPVLQPKLLANKNINVASAAPALGELKPFSPLVMDVEPKRENAYGLAPHARPRVGSGARRTALGWSKRSTGTAKSSSDKKENVVAAGTIMTPGDNLRLNRPRPRGRPTPGGRTPAAQNRSIRI
ncbi:hypothetical protein BDN70DRAFT_892146 [Pholiota conissans]|uniref:Uncharacterized protein n=1 Tax=Pholiota conissans TaxID=109636 RepID=A0A9P5Z8M0_9AGAR|nr:hypothetical protein BDN70DRAFT_892146 [Pholiota conissans]